MKREEIPDVWLIDRREVVKKIYYHRDGKLELVNERYDIHGWPPGEQELYTPILLECFDYGGYFIGAYDQDILIGVGVLENRFVGPSKDKLQLKFLHVSHDYRGRGLGRKLFNMCATEARKRGAQRLYISATPSENTIKFYQSLGCQPAAELDPDLFKLEPMDIHLELALN